MIAAPLLALAVAWNLAQVPGGLASPNGPPTADSTQALRDAVRAHPDSFDLLLTLGRILAHHANEVEGDFHDRIEAEGYLDRAVRLRRDDPRAWLEYGLLSRKQRKNVDALRALQRAEDLAGRADSSLSAGERADLHEQMALIYETWWEDWANLPRALEELKEHDRAAMVRHYAAAVDADPARLEPAVRLLRWLADWGKWDEYLGRANQLVQRRPDDAEAWLFLGLGLHETGKTAPADSAFKRALAVASPDLRATLLDFSQLLRKRDSASLVAFPAAQRDSLGATFWAERDPLFLTPENEREAEHFARVAYADLAFSEPASALPGRYTDRGHYWIAYGRPDRVRTMMSTRYAGRHVSWAYRAPPLSLTFTRQLTYRYARETEMSEWVANQVRDSVPELYRPTHPRLVAVIPFQAARFRGPEKKTQLEIYGLVPAGSLGQTDSIVTGLFAFGLHPWRKAAEGRRVSPVPGAFARVQFVASLAPDHYLISVEAMGNDRAATGRDSIVIPPPESGLALSDLLLADSVVAPAAVRTRRDLMIAGSPTLTFRRGNPVGVVWEVYGLVPDAMGTVRYHVALDVRDAKRGALVRAFRSLTGQGNKPASVVEWDRQDELASRGAAVEYATIMLDGVRPGTYRLRVTVTDRATGTTATSERQFQVIR